MGKPNKHPLAQEFGTKLRLLVYEYVERLNAMTDPNEQASAQGAILGALVAEGCIGAAQSALGKDHFHRIVDDVYAAHALSQKTHV